jgi:hypothetical protein
MTFPLYILHLLPPAIHHTIVCLSLNHFINSLPIGTDREVAVTNRSKVYHHRGAALRALSQHIAQDRTRCGDLTIASVMMFLCLEVRFAYFRDGGWGLANGRVVVAKSLAFRLAVAR